jgi:hypothetical protein
MHIIQKKEAVNGHVTHDISREMGCANTIAKHVVSDNISQGIPVTIVLQNHQVHHIQIMELVIGLVTPDITEMVIPVFRILSIVE